MSLTHWTRAPDKVVRFGDMPVMLWTKPGDIRAICGEVEVSVCIQSTGRYAGPIRCTGKLGEFGGYGGAEWPEEPSPELFESYVLRVLDLLSREGRL
ncbi:MAG TPA: hypothetical protein VMI31_02645 [Fimbriimonadaceae bacterium]|nr:hypothetical protein [Fimbriimonadaceae bacterium]